VGGSSTPQAKRKKSSSALNVARGEEIQRSLILKEMGGGGRLAALLIVSSHGKGEGAQRVAFICWGGGVRTKKTFDCPT